MNSTHINLGSFTGWSYHQAGHLVAAALRGADPATRIRLDQLMEPGYCGEAGAPFIAFAGPWAERACGAADVEIVHGDDAFDPAALSARCGDRDVVDEASSQVATLLRHVGADEDRAWGWLPGVTAAWNGELAQAWPAIEWAAGQLRADLELSVAQVRSRLAAA